MSDVNVGDFINVVAWWYTEILCGTYAMRTVEWSIVFSKYGRGIEVEYIFWPNEWGLGYPMVRLRIYRYDEGHVWAEMLVSFYRGEQHILVKATATDMSLGPRRFWMILLRIAQILEIMEE